MADRLPKPTTVNPRTHGSPQYPNLVFISHDTSTSVGEHNTNISHGRRLQIDKRHRDKRALAQQGATYARSLVGWKPPPVAAEHASSSWRRAPGEVHEFQNHEFDKPRARDLSRQYPMNNSERDEEEIERQENISPTTILKRGQSDPFNALAVEVTPNVNEIVSFFRETMILAFYHTKWKDSKAAIVSMHWQTVVHTLYSRGGALGFLGRNGQILSIISNDKRIKYAALKYTSQSTAILRARLGETTELSASDQWHISMLWGTEITFRNLDAALLHGRIIKGMVEDQVAKGTLDLVAFRYILYYDIHLCTMLMVRSVFDYFRWVPDKYRQLESLATSLMKLPVDGDDDAAIGLDPSIQSEVLLPLFQQRRRHMREYAWWLARSFEEFSPYLLGWLAVGHHICHGQLISYALDCIDNAAQCVFAQRSRLLAEAYISLATLYVTRTGAGGQLILCGIDIFEARRSILDKLYSVLKWAEDYQDQACLSYRNAKLWALYVGARGARTLRTKPDTYEWFFHEFQRTRIEIGLSSWVQTQEVLGGFLHHEAINPIDDGTLVELVE